MNPVKYLLFPLLLLFAALSCGKQPNGAAPSSRDARAEEVSSLRIISTAPSITEILFGLGLGDHVVGVSDFCDYPPEAAKLPKVGGVVNPNVEAIVALQPDLVLGVPNVTHDNLYRSLRQLGIKMLDLPNDSVKDLYAMIRRIGNETKTEQKAEEMASRLQAKFAEVSKRVSGSPKRKVMFVVGMDPLFVAGHGTFIDELITLAGGENIAADSAMKYPQVSIEEAVARAPDIIFYTSLNFELTAQQEEQAKKIWSPYSSIPAVKEGRIYGLEADHVTLPGPRLELGIEEMARRIHPEAYPKSEQAR